jgi:hypothetical protein
MGNARYLAERIQYLERQVADLQRVRNPPQLYVEPEESAGGGEVEAFSFVVDHTTTGLDSLATLKTSADRNAFHTSGVSLSGTDTINLPAGLWLIGLDVEVSWWSGLPTDGEFSIGAAPNNTDTTNSYLGSLDHEDFDWTSQPPTISGANLYNLTSTRTLNVYFYNDMNVTVTIWGSVWGVEVSPSALTTY